MREGVKPETARIGGCFAPQSFDPECFDTGPEVEVDPDEQPQRGDEQPLETRAATAERVTLTKDKAELLAVLMPLAADTPRDAKRFINLSWLARASRSTEALRGFLGGGSDALAVAAFTLALACESGLAGAPLRLWRTALGTRPAGAVIAASPLLLGSGNGWQPLRRALLRADRFCTGAGSALHFEDVAQHAAEACRYSFHPPQVDEPAPPPEAPPEPTGSSPA
jgi:hypothetical protein